MANPVIPTEIDDEITLNSIINEDGDGIFNKMLNQVRTVLKEEYQNSRIRGTDYANVLLGSMQTLMSESVRFGLQKTVQEKQGDLLEAQIQETDTRALNLEAQREIYTHQADKEKGEALIAHAKVSQEQAQFKDLIDIYDADLTVLRDQPLTGLLAIEKSQGEKNELLLQEQINKAIQEAGLLRRKRTTEEAQTTNTPNVYDENNNATQITVQENETGGVIGRENSLRGMQTEGFKRDAEQKLSKIMLDALAIRLEKGDDLSAAGSSGFSDSDIKAVVDNARNNLLNG